VPVETVQCILKLRLKQRILAVYHDFHSLLAATKLLISKLHPRYVEESIILERSYNLPPGSATLVCSSLQFPNLYFAQRLLNQYTLH